jgi:hypothetical protein
MQQQQQQLLDVLAQAGGLESVARELGVNETQARTGASALIPAILGGFKKQAQSRPDGLEGLTGMLGGLGGGGLMDEVLAPRQTNVAPGNDILGQIFGSKDVSRTVAQSASARTGLDPALLKKMLPVLAMLVAGYMAKRARSATPTTGAAEPPMGQPQPSGIGDRTRGSGGGGGLGDLLGGVLGGNPGAGAGAATRGGAGGGLASMLDLDGDGNPLDDLLGMAGKFLRK